MHEGLGNRGIREEVGCSEQMVAKRAKDNPALTKEVEDTVNILNAASHGKKPLTRKTVPCRIYVRSPLKLVIKYRENSQY